MLKGLKNTVAFRWARRLTTVAALLMAVAKASAQTEPEYRMEIGAGLALANYLGDFNGNLLRQPQPMASIVARYKLNPRMAWDFNLGYTRLKGDSDNADTWQPELPEGGLKFSSKLIDAQVRYEYNFWPFGTGKEYHGAQPLTPFIALGLGIASASGDGTGTGLQMPIGAGVKYKLADRWNLTLDWIMHFTTLDKIDAAKDPEGIKSSGMFKNTDCYSTLQLSLTYDFWERCRVCHNDND